MIFLRDRVGTPHLYPVTPNQLAIRILNRERTEFSEVKGTYVWTWIQGVQGNLYLDAKMENPAPNIITLIIDCQKL